MPQTLTLKGMVVRTDFKGYVRLTLLPFLVAIFFYHLFLEFINRPYGKLWEILIYIYMYTYIHEYIFIYFYLN